MKARLSTAFAPIAIILACVLPTEHALATERQLAQLHASTAAGQVHVRFEAGPDTAHSVAEYLDGTGSVVLTWVVDLHRVVRGWHDAAVQHSTVQMVAREGRTGVFEVSRRLNGQQTGPNQMVDRDAASALLAAFDLPMFDAAVPRGVYEVRVRAVLGAGPDTFTTGTLARVDVKP